VADAFESLAVIPNSTDNFDEVWCVVDRGNGKMIESMANRIIHTTDANDENVMLRENQIRLDSCVTYNASATIFEGLEHLEGLEVGILADGKVLDQATVTSSSVTTSTAYTKVCIGLPYYSDLETLDINAEFKDGSIHGSKVKVGNVMFRQVNSKGGYIGPDEDNLYEAFTDLIISRNQSELSFSPLDYDWTTQSVSDPDPYLFTGDIRKPLGAGWSKGGRTFFRQSDPVPTTITAVVPEVSVGKAV